MKNTILLKVFIGIAAGILVGSIAGTDSSIFGIAWFKIFHLIGQLFLNALTLVVVPLVTSSIITGTSRVGTDEAFGRLGRRTFFYFVLTCSIAVSIGLFLTLLIAPGKGIEEGALHALTGSTPLAGIEKHVQGGIFEKFEQIFYRLVPSNVVAVASQGQLLGLIAFSLLFGYFIPRLDRPLSDTLSQFWNGTFQIMMRMTELIMKALPLGVFALMAKITATTGLGAIKPVALFFMVVVGGLALDLCVALPLLLKIRGVNPWRHFRAISPALVTAFTTSSSAATLPITLECMEKRAGIPNRICSFVLPLGTSLNLAGSALYVTCAVVFIAQAYQLELHAGVLFTIFLMGIFSGLGMVAGIPSASLITLVIVLQTIGLPADGMVLVLAVDRILDMCRTAVTVFNHSCCAALLNESFREKSAIYEQ